MNFSIGETVGAYRILQELGHGGMGRVFKVEHTITRRLEAMKVLEGGRPEAPEQAARSLREIQLQASLDHPNIAAVHNAFWVGEDLVLVMELIDGCSLRSVLEGQRPPLATALNYARQALSALSYAHEHGVIHRDISTANIMVTPLGVLKLTDFGLAKGSADVRVSRSGAPLGTLHYMSPEQVRGAETDARSDIYSFGAVLYELATGKRPFEGDSAFSIMANHIDKLPVAPVEVEGGLPHSLNNAILRSLEKNPAQRFSSAEEFLCALMEGQNNISEFKSKLSSSIPRSLFVSATAAVAIVSLLVVGLFGSHRLLWQDVQSAVLGHKPDNLVHENKNAAQATIELSTPSPAPVRTVESQPSSAKRSPNGSPTMRVLAHDPANVDSDVTAKRGRNPVMKVLGKVWHLGRRRKPPLEDDSQNPSGNSDP